MDDQIRNVWTDELRELIMQDEGYKGYTLLETPTKFSELFADYDDISVEVDSTDIWEINGKKGIWGFCGVFRWKDKKAIPLDGDSYNKDMTVFGYRWKLEGVLLFVLVGNDW
jgi:hypothetical protein